MKLASSVINLSTLSIGFILSSLATNADGASVRGNVPATVLRELAEEDGAGDEGKPWGKMLGYTFAVNLITLSGLVFLVPLLITRARKQDTTTVFKWIHIVIPSFACGSLLALAFFIVIPESLYLIMSGTAVEDDTDDHGHAHRFLQETDDTHDEHEGEIPTSVIWRFSSAVLAGFMTPMLIGLFLPSHSHDHVIVQKDAPAVPDEDFKSDILVEDKAKDETTNKYNYQLIFSLIVGDALCNFADGIFVGLSLLQCDLAVTASVIGGVVYHEISQEVTDYFLFTTEGGLSPVQALAINFLGGLTVCLGGIVVFATSVSDMGVGVGLAISCGVYIHISCSEVFPRIRGVLHTRLERVVSMLFFILGVVPLGLVLLNHVHCHADHDHDHDY